MQCNECRYHHSSLVQRRSLDNDKNIEVGPLEKTAFQ